MRMHNNNGLIYLAFLLLPCIIGCADNYINFEVQAPKTKNGVFVINDDEGHTAYSANLKNGGLTLKHQYFTKPGYYTLTLAEYPQKQMPAKFDIYLEPGDYSLFFKNNSDDYPQIKSPSPIQQDLSAYFQTERKMRHDRKRSYDQAKEAFDKVAGLPGNAYKAAGVALEKAKAEQANADKDVLIDLLRSHPGSLAAAHIIAGQNYETDPAGWYNVYEKLSPQAKLTDDGQTVGERLGALVKLLPGHRAPDISGGTPDGKPFNAALLTKKIYLVEFWNAGSQFSREKHNEVNIANLRQSIQKQQYLGIISIALEKKRDWWLSAIKEDKLTWPQYCDLKGRQSVNVTNWGISKIPTYYLIDGRWNIIDRDIFWEEIPVTVNGYLKAH